MDVSLDEIIQKNMSFSLGGRLGDGRRGSSRGVGGSKRGAGASHFQSNGADGGGGSGGGDPMRRRGSRARHANGFNPYSNTYDTYEGPKRRQLKDGLSTTNIHKIVITNLDFGVISSDIQELFQEFGPLKTATVHYDISGRSLGTADVVFKSKNSALKAVRRYNNVFLDGRPMKIELATDLSTVANIANRLTRPAPLVVRGLVKIIIVQGGRGNRVKRGNTRGTSRRRRAGRGGRKSRINNPNKDRLDAQLHSFIRSNNN